MTTRGQKALRDPPAFQVYASDDLAREAYFLLSLAERGLYDAMRRACWVNGSVPADPDGIAIAIRGPVEEVRAALTSAVRARFETTGEVDQMRLLAPDLDDQRREIMFRRTRQSDGAKATNRNRWGSKHQQPASHSDSLIDSVSESLLSRDELSRVEMSREESKASLEKVAPAFDVSQSRILPALSKDDHQWAAEYHRGEADLEAKERGHTNKSARSNLPKPARPPQPGKAVSTGKPATGTTAEAYRKASNGG
jgi:hypothetical protein